MTEFHIVGLILALFLNATLGLGLRYFAIHYCRGPRGVLWRQAGGVGLIFGCAFLYRFVFRPPFDGLLIVPVLFLEVLLIVLLLEREKILEYEPWGGHTANGNLKRATMHTIEDLMAVQDRAWERHREQERDLLMWKMLNVALRSCEPTRSVADLERMVDEAMADDHREPPR